MESPADRMEAVFKLVGSEFRPNLLVPVAKLDEAHRVLPRRHTNSLARSAGRSLETPYSLISYLVALLRAKGKLSLSVGNVRDQASSASAILVRSSGPSMLCQNLVVSGPKSNDTASVSRK